MNGQYVDADGNLQVAFSTSMPGLMLIPDGHTPDTVQHLTDEEFADIAATPTENNPTMSDLQAQMRTIQSELDKMAANTPSDGTA